MQTVILQRIIYIEERKKKKMKPQLKIVCAKQKMATDENTARGQRWTIKILQ